MRTIEEKNRMIVEFMGYETYEHTNSTAIRLTEGNEFNSIDIGHVHTKFHTSWDWLMPVVEEIESICGCHLLITPTVTNIEYKKIKISQWQHSKIKNTYEAVCEFIKMYNENK